ncbi:hypothetical protein IAT38_005034 [Cryptococcus sp. DSM 104549]
MDSDPWADAPPSTPVPSSLPALPLSPSPSSSPSSQKPEAATPGEKKNGKGKGKKSKEPSRLSEEVARADDGGDTPAKEEAGEVEVKEPEVGAVEEEPEAVKQIPDSQETEPEAEISPASPPAPASPAPARAPALAPPPTDEGEAPDDGFDDFDDFDAPTAGPSDSSANLAGGDAFGDAAGADGDDGFGDFGDFEEGDFEEAPAGEVKGGEGFGGVGVVAEPEVVEERWRALELRPFPPRGELLDQLLGLIAPLTEDPAGLLTDEQPRMVGGLAQVLVAESSRDAYAQLTTPPMLKPLDWTRSRVRRDHLISMGVPVNLDEVDSHRLSALPPLRITTAEGAAAQRQAQAQGRPVPRRAETLDGARWSTEQKGKGREAPRGAMSAGVDGQAGGAVGKYGLGQRPPMDMAKAEDLCGVEEDQLTLLPIASLRKIQQELVENSAQASATLAWMLQLKDAQTQDSATYNGMISSLIANAAKAKSASSSGGGVFRRGSTKRPQSVGGGGIGSGAATPRRTGSPGMW